MRSQYLGQHSDDALMAQDCIPTSLLKLSADNSTRAVKMFAGVQKYMAESGDAPVGTAKAELVQKLLHQVHSPALAVHRLGDTSRQRPHLQAQPGVRELQHQTCGC